MLRISVEAITTVVGVSLLVCAVGANQSWLDRHFLPSFLLPRHVYVAIETAVRVALAVIGAVLIAVRPRVARLATAAPILTLEVAAAVVLAVGVSEPALRRLHLQPTEWLVPSEEPLRRADARLGWTLVPNRLGHATVGGRSVDYAIDAAGDRVRDLAEPVDPDRPAIVFAGESVMFGEGLTWDESIPAQVGAMLGVQGANIAVHGYATDQILMELEADLPRFRRPVAVVSLFMTALVGRNLDRERPHLDARLAWQPAEPHWRLNSLARLLVPYHSVRVVDEGIAMTRSALRATVELARRRGAAPLIVVPQLGREDATERSLRHRIFDGTGLPYAFVELDAAWHLPWDRHPDARGARAVAAAIAGRLRER
jgi:hypothetical protein